MKTLTITVVGVGVGSTVPTPGTHQYAVDSVVSGITALPDPGYEFTRWILDGVTYTSNPITVVMDTDHTLEAEFSGEAPPPPPKYNLRVTSTEGGITEPGVGIYPYDDGNMVMVTALPSEGYQFDSWQLDGATRTENPITVTMNQDHSVHAIFTEVTAPDQPEFQTAAVGGCLLLILSIAAAAALYARYKGVI